MLRHQELYLRNWLTNTKRKPLLLRGARQTGKSYLIREFCRNAGLNLHEINLEKNLGLQKAFKGLQVSHILNELEFAIGRGKISGNGNNILFLDEIQALPEAIQALRYFYEELPNLPVIAAGSLVEFAFSKRNISVPVGRIEYLYMGPMLFKEFLGALGEKDLLYLLSSYKIGEVFPTSAHERLLELQRLYLLIGGMPEALKQYVDSLDLSLAFKVQTDIVETFRDDFGKYATQAQLSKLQKVFQYVPLSIGEKIKYANIDRHEKAANLRSALFLLAQAQVVTLAFHANASGLPLKATIDEKIYKPFLLDCGLMNRMCGLERLSIHDLKRREFINEGKLAEQFLAQHLLQLGPLNEKPTLNYWLREGKLSNAEVDFVCQRGSAVIPIEAKAGHSGSMKSLLQFVFEKKSKLAIRFDLNPPFREKVKHQVFDGKKNREVKFELLSLPLYMVEEMGRLI